VTKAFDKGKTPPFTILISRGKRTSTQRSLHEEEEEEDPRSPNSNRFGEAKHIKK